MKTIPPKIHIGPRTIKTVAAVIISMIVVDLYGATTSKLIFAMLGAMAAVQPTFKESVESCLTQIVGVLFGALAGVLLLALPVHPLISTAIGLILVITLYNMLHIRFSPSLPCFIVVMVCTTPDIQPMAYAFGRIWDNSRKVPFFAFRKRLLFFMPAAPVKTSFVILFSPRERSRTATRAPNEWART